MHSSHRHMVVTLEARSDVQLCQERQQPESVAEAGRGQQKLQLSDIWKRFWHVGSPPTPQAVRDCGSGRAVSLSCHSKPVDTCVVA